MAQGDHTNSYLTSGAPIRRKVDVAATGASASAGLGLANQSVLFDDSTLGYKVGETFSRHIIQCTVDSGTWVVKGYGPAGAWDLLPNLAADNAVAAVASGKLWIVDAKGFEAIGVEFSADGNGKASIASILTHA